MGRTSLSGRSRVTTVERGLSARDGRIRGCGNGKRASWPRMCAFASQARDRYARTAMLAMPDIRDRLTAVSASTGFKR